jgi:predicted lipase
MLTVPWFYIPLSIIIFTILLYFVIISIIEGKIHKFIKKLKKDLKIDMKKLCKDEYTLSAITPFTNIKLFNKSNAYAFFNLNLAVSSWSGCNTKIPIVENFQMLKFFKAYDHVAKKQRDISILYYSQTLNMLLLSFSGTMYISEWIEDLDFTQVNPTSITNNTDIMVHKQHYKMYNSMRDELINFVKNIGDSNTLFVITGHSLGGSLASICFLDLILNNISPNKILYTFGAPRTGNSTFSNIISQNISFRIANTADIVPDLPLAITGDYIYEHYGILVSFTLNLGKYNLNHVDAYSKFLEN